MVSYGLSPFTASHEQYIQVGGFSSAISGGIAQLAGQRGLNGWQWIFIMFGASTILAGIIAFFCTSSSLRLTPPDTLL